MATGCQGYYVHLAFPGTTWDPLALLFRQSSHLHPGESPQEHEVQAQECFTDFSADLGEEAHIVCLL